MNNYSGSAAGLLRTDATTISEPQDDIDDVAVSTVNTMASKLADWIQWAKTWAAFGDGIANALPFIFNGAAGDTNAAIISTAAVTSFKLLWHWNMGAANAKRIRFYSGAGVQLVITVNAAWDGSNWDSDDASACLKVVIDYTGMYIYQHATGANFADGTWIGGDAKIAHVIGGSTAPAPTAGAAYGGGAAPTLTGADGSGAATDSGGMVTMVNDGTATAGAQVSIAFATGHPSTVPKSVTLTPAGADGIAPAYFIHPSHITAAAFEIWANVGPTAATHHVYYQVNW